MNRFGSGWSHLKGLLISFKTRPIISKLNILFLIQLTLQMAQGRKHLSENFKGLFRICTICLKLLYN